jgi:hypothetical protein
MVLSFIIVSVTYYLKNYIQNKEKEIILNQNSKTKVSSLKKKFNIKSTEQSKTKKINTVTSTNKIKNKNDIDIITLPIDTPNTKFLVNNISKDLINELKEKTKLKNIDLFKKIILSFINCKNFYKKIFEPNETNLFDNMDNLKNFSNLYRNELLLNNKYNNFEVVIKLSNCVDPDLYIKMKKNKLIKISQTDNYKKLNNSLQKNTIFLINNKDNYYIGYGNKYSSEIKTDQIKKIFFNNLDITDTKIIKNYELFSKYKIITFLYWTQTLI